MPFAASKRSYHPFILIAYYLNSLPQDIIQGIPYSTQYEWKHKDPECLYGTQYFRNNKKLFRTLESVAQNRKLQTTVQLLLKIIALKKFISNYQHRLKINYVQIRRVALANIQKLNRWRSFPIFRQENNFSC